MNRNILLAVGVILLFLGVGVQPAIAIGSDSLGFIQDLIDNASDGDTIYIPSGTYYENIVIDKSISLVGEDRDTTIIDGSGVGDVVFISADWVNITGFTIRNSGVFTISYYEAGIDINSKYVTITDNNISNNYRGINIDYTFEGPHSIIIMDNVISNNIFYGIDIIFSFNNIIKGNSISNNLGGIMLHPSDSNTIIDNVIFDNDRYGIYLWGSQSNTISNNSFFNDGLYVSSDNNIVENNTVNGKPLVYLEEESDEVIDYEVGQIIIVNCNNITVENLNLSKTIIGIEFYQSHSCTIRNIDCFKCKSGILLLSSTGITIIVNNIRSNSRGIHLDNSKLNNISRNNISNNSYGVYIEDSQSNTISNNNILKNDEGVYLTSYAYYFFDIFTDGSINNIILKNNIFGNKLNADFENSFLNRWRWNYWGRPRLLPKLILGTIDVGDRAFIYWFNIDWLPAKEPYDI